MAIFRLKNLLLSSFLFWLTGCAIPLKYKLVQEKTVEQNDIFTSAQGDSAVVYKTQVFLFNKYFTGILLDKKTDDTTHRLVFVTEIGMKMFDLKITPSGPKMIYCFNPLSKPKTIGLLENDFGFLWFEKLINKKALVFENNNKKRIYLVKQDKKKYFYYAKELGLGIEKSIIKGSMFTKQIAVYKYDLGNAVESVSLKHKGLLRLKIKLSKIKHE